MEQPSNCPRNTHQIILHFPSLLKDNSASFNFLESFSPVANKRNKNKKKSKSNKRYTMNADVSSMAVSANGHLLFLDFLP